MRQVDFDIVDVECLYGVDEIGEVDFGVIGYALVGGIVDGRNG